MALWLRVRCGRERPAISWAVSYQPPTRFMNRAFCSELQDPHQIPIKICAGPGRGMIFAGRPLPARLHRGGKRRPKEFVFNASRRCHPSPSGVRHIPGVLSGQPSLEGRVSSRIEFRSTAPAYGLPRAKAAITSRQRRTAPRLLPLNSDLSTSRLVGRQASRNAPLGGVGLSAAPSPPISVAADAGHRVGFEPTACRL